MSGSLEGKRVLDIGCLEGYFSTECALPAMAMLRLYFVSLVYAPRSSPPPVT